MSTPSNTVEAILHANHTSAQTGLWNILSQEIEARVDYVKRMQSAANRLLTKANALTESIPHIKIENPEKPLSDSMAEITALLTQMDATKSPAYQEVITWFENASREFGSSKDQLSLNTAAQRHLKTLIECENQIIPAAAEAATDTTQMLETLCKKSTKLSNPQAVWSGIDFQNEFMHFVEETADAWSALKKQLSELERQKINGIDPKGISPNR